MTRRFRAPSVLLLALATGSVAAGQGAPPPGSASEAARTRGAIGADAPLGIALEEVSYPHPVRFLPLQIEGQDLRMAYMDVAPTGRSNGRAAVLLHGKNFSGDYWSGTIGVLAAAGYRVVVPDQIGFGKSSIAGIRYSFDLLAANTAKLLDALGISRASVVGHSMGGMLAVRFARNFPERTERLVLVNPIGLEDYRLQVPPLPFEAVYARELANTDREKIDAFFRRYFAVWRPEYERFTDRRTRVAGSGEYPRFARAAALTYEMIYEQPVRHEFGRIAVPTLLVIGQSDRTTVGRGLVPETALKGLGDYPALGKAAARDIPGSRLLELPGVGHLPHLEAADKFHSVLVEFLGS
ncbi:MAG: alpha/beta hydrolase [Acidobacteriota bacterium]|nr:alpha/beta hydrolase [Acidobacteriota bacterium]